jgi:hypothetical protein
MSKRGLFQEKRQSIGLGCSAFAVNGRIKYDKMAETQGSFAGEANRSAFNAFIDLKETISSQKTIVTPRNDDAIRDQSWTQSNVAKMVHSSCDVGYAMVWFT